MPQSLVQNSNDIQNQIQQLVKGQQELQSMMMEFLNGKQRGPKIKNKIVKYTRGEAMYDDIFVMPFDEGSERVQIVLITKGKDAAPVIELKMDDFLELCNSAMKGKSGKSIKIRDYVTLNMSAMYLDDDGWEIVPNN